MRYLSVCSGIEAASVAWRGLGWEAAGFAEIEAFPSAVLHYHYPEVKNFGDFTKIGPDDVGGFGSVDLLVGGTPCQSFSVAGARLGMDDPRGNLAIEFLRLARRIGTRWILFENVPGLLSSAGGRDFGAFLGLMGECGFGWSYRVLDAQYFGVPQRRRRVFVVGHFGDWRSAAAVLFESHSLSGSPAPRRKAGQGASFCVTARYGSGHNDPTAETYVTGTLMASGAGMERPAGMASEPDFLVAHYDEDGFHYHRQKVAHPLSAIHSSGVTEDGGGRGVPIVTAFSCKDDGDDATNDLSPTLRLMHHADGGQPNGGGQVAIASATSVRRLLPVECERLQGFPDDYTLVPYRGKPASDGPRYRSLGNSFAVPVVRWIGERIAMVDSMERDV